MTAETARDKERVESFREASLLVPVVMRTLLNEDTSGMVKWGVDLAWLDHTLVLIDVGRQHRNEISAIINSGKYQVWGVGRDDSDYAARRAVERGGDAPLARRWRLFWVFQSIKATVMAISGGIRSEYEERMSLVRLLQREPDIFDEIWGQLLIQGSVEKRERVKKLLGELNFE